MFSQKSGKEGWTAIGVTVRTKERFVVMKSSFEKMLNQGPQTWDYFLQAMLNLGPLTWNFLIAETVKSIQAEMKACPLPGSSDPPPSKREQGL